MFEEQINKIVEIIKSIGFVKYIGSEKDIIDYTKYINGELKSIVSYSNKYKEYIIFNITIITDKEWINTHYKNPVDNKYEDIIEYLKIHFKYDFRKNKLKKLIDFL